MATVTVNWECVSCNETFHYLKVDFCKNNHPMCPRCFKSKYPIVGCRECLKATLPALEIIPIPTPRPPSPNRKHLVPTKGKGRSRAHKSRMLFCEGSKFGIWNCDWTGKYSKLTKHFTDKHKDSYGILAKQDVTCWLNLRKEQRSLTLVHYDGELFYYKYRADLTTMKFYLVVQMIGPQEKAEKYMFRYQTIKGGRICYVQEFCFSDEVSDAEICAKEKCVVLPLLKLWCYSTKNAQPFEVRLVKAANPEMAQPPT